MYAGQDWDPLDVVETDVFSLNFINDLNPGEGITLVTFTIGVTYGNDPTPSLRLVGIPGIAGTVVSQTVSQPPAPGIIYWLAGQVVTTAGRRLELWGHFPSVAPT
jgi:hypothetical protein